MACESERATYHSCSNSNSFIPSLSFPLFLSHSSALFPLPPFPLSSCKNHHPQERRRGGPPSTTFGARASALSPSSYSPRLAVAIAHPSLVSLPFSPFPVLLTNSYSSLTQALRATPAPPHAQALLRGSGTFFFLSFLIQPDLKCIGHVITAASTAQPTMTRYQPQLVTRRRYPLAQRARRAGEREAATSSCTPVTGRRGADDCDRADTTSTMWRRRPPPPPQRQRPPPPATTTATTTSNDDDHHPHCDDDHDGCGGDANGGSGSEVVITVALA